MFFKQQGTHEFQQNVKSILAFLILSSTVQCRNEVKGLCTTLLRKKEDRTSSKQRHISHLGLFIMKQLKAQKNKNKKFNILDHWEQWY